MINFRLNMNFLYWLKILNNIKDFWQIFHIGYLTNFKKSPAEITDKVNAYHCSNPYSIDIPWTTLEVIHINGNLIIDYLLYFIIALLNLISLYSTGA